MEEKAMPKDRWPMEEVEAHFSVTQELKADSLLAPISSFHVKKIQPSPFFKLNVAL
jgi:hypothetical protein